jgi:hypothetical protein
MVASWCDSGVDVKRVEAVNGYRGTMWWYPPSVLAYEDGVLETNVALYKYFM